jgi:hypothetical protein
MVFEIVKSKNRQCAFTQNSKLRVFLNAELRSGDFFSEKKISLRENEMNFIKIVCLLKNFFAVLVLNFFRANINYKFYLLVVCLVFD